VFENRVLRRIFAPASEKVTGRWRKLLELHNLYYSQNIIVIKSRRMGRTCSTFGRGEKFIQIFIRKT
jgi:hypothetical protein